MPAPPPEMLAEVLAEVNQVLARPPDDRASTPATVLAEGWRVEFYWRRSKAGRRAYFHYRRGSGNHRTTRYGGAIAIACTRHPQRVAEFLARTQWVPTNLPERCHAKRRAKATEDAIALP